MSDQPAFCRKILVATDFSQPGQAAVQRGVWLAQAAQTGVTVAHVLKNLREAFTALPYADKSEFLYGDVNKFERALRAESQQQLTKAVREFARKNVDVTTEVLLGKPETALTRAVLKEQYDTVIVGTRGLTGVKRFLLGSTAARLVRQCPASVWIVKPENVWPPKRILVGIDFSEVSRRALAAAGWMAAKTKAHLDVVHVIDQDDMLAGLKGRQRDSVKATDLGRQIAGEAEQRMEQWCEETLAGKTPRALHVLWGTPWKVIADRARRWKSDLAVMGAIGRGGIRGMLIGNTAEKLLQHCDCSLFTLKPADFISPIPAPFWELHPGAEPPTALPG